MGSDVFSVGYNEKDDGGQDKADEGIAKVYGQYPDDKKKCGQTYGNKTDISQGDSACKVFHGFVDKKTCIGDDEEKQPFFNRKTKNKKTNGMIVTEGPDVVLFEKYIPDKKGYGSNDYGRNDVLQVLIETKRGFIGFCKWIGNGNQQQ